MKREEKKINNESIDVVHMKDDEEDKIYIGKYLPHFFLFTIILFFCVFGITYSIYKGDNGEDSEIITDQIIFTYSDVDKVGNGILINNATPIPDALGKSMIGKNEYFDFYITATTGKSNVLYRLLVNKDESSTLIDSNVKIYLTKMLGTYENELVIKKFSDLEIKDLNNKKYYVLYEKILDSNLVNHSDSYRLRMWVSDDAVNYDNQSFSIKIDVHAEQIGE